MASLYLPRTSKFYWIKFKDPSNPKKVCRKSTKLSSLNPMEVRKARLLEAEYTLKERSYVPGGPFDGGWLWVNQFLRTNYLSRAATLERFLRERKIPGPAQFTRQHCYDYIAWRGVPDVKHGKFNACHNTALLELKIMSIIMTEAVIRDFCPGNPCVKLGVRREPVRQSPELTEEHIDFIRRAIAAEQDEKIKEFLEITFELGRWQGCRLGATALNPLRDVVLNGEKSTIRFVSKGKDFVTLLHPRLIPMFERLREKKRSATWTPPAGTQRRTWASLQWTRFIERARLRQRIPGFTYRSLRVTVITRMARNNVPISKAKEFVKHASTTVHFVYQRLSPEDLSDCAKAIE